MGMLNIREVGVFEYRGRGLGVKDLYGLWQEAILREPKDVGSS